MRFLVTRTSSWTDPPCPEAFKLLSKVGWYVDLSSLEELLAFVRTHGKIVVETDPQMLIEIYDFYRE